MSRMLSIVGAYLALALATPGPALAQTTVPGMPPVRAVGNPEELQLPRTKAEESEHLETAALAQQVGRLASDLQAATGRPSAPELAPPPALIAVQPGVVQVIPIGVDRLNRIKTPFTLPEVKTVSETAMIETEGSVVYVSTETRDPISLFITERGAPDVALSLQLMPARIPQIDTQLEIEGVSRIAMPVRRERAQDWEMEQPYVETLVRLMSTLARQEVPHGFGMKAFTPAEMLFAPSCSFPPGVQVRPAQILTGSNLIAVISEVRNTSTWSFDLDESSCGQQGVLAVASYPHLRLAPGQSTELYIARELPQAAPATQTRPTVMEGAQ